MNRYFTPDEVKLMAGQHPENELLRIATNYNTSKLYDPECFGYFKHYWHHFVSFRGRSTKLLEIGVKDGQSLLMWREFFGGLCRTFGIEIGPMPTGLPEDVTVLTGDQADIDFLCGVAEKFGPFDIIIDDGGHTMLQQQLSFGYLFPKALADNGLYVIEDIGTSYWPRWGGGLKRPGTTIEFVKDLMDSISYRFHKGGRVDYVGIPESAPSNYFDTHVEALHFYRGLAFIEKRCNISV